MSETGNHVGKGWTFSRQEIGAKPKWFVIDCSCGWTTPLCALASQAKERFQEHREECDAANKNSDLVRT